MPYQPIPVLEEHIPAVYELLASLSRAGTTPTPIPPSEEEADEEDYYGPDDRKLETLIGAVTEDMRTVFKTVALMPDTTIGYDDLEEKAGLPNLGAALQSLGIQTGKLDMYKPLKAQRRDGRFVYWMTAATAEHVLRILRKREADA